MGTSPYSNPFFSTRRTVQEAASALEEKAEAADTPHESRCARYTAEDLEQLEVYIGALERAGMAADRALLELAERYPDAEEFAEGNAGFEALKTLDSAMFEGTPLEGPPIQELLQRQGRLRAVSNPVEPEDADRGW